MWFHMFLNARAFLATFIFIISILPNACFIEQVIAWAVEIVQTESHHHDEHASDDHHRSAPSHSHDEEGHEGEFCCDNPFYFYFVAQKKIDLKKTYQAWLHFQPAYVHDELEKKSLILSRYQILAVPPIAIRNRDRFAITSLLRSPPLA